MVKINFWQPQIDYKFTHHRKRHVMVNIILLHQKFNKKITSSNKLKLKLSHSL